MMSTAMPADSKQLANRIEELAGIANKSVILKPSYLPINEAVAMSCPVLPDL